MIDCNYSIKEHIRACEDDLENNEMYFLSLKKEATIILTEDVLDLRKVQEIREKLLNNLKETERLIASINLLKHKLEISKINS